MNILYVMIGCPGSGKTTFINNLSIFKNAVHVSRDEIRFSLLGDNDEYFSKENEVFEKFIDKIRTNLNEGNNVIADATHLNPRSRAKLFKSLSFNFNNIKVIGIFMHTSLEECLKNNENRKGRSYVPREQIERMFFSIKTPSFYEYDFIFSELWKVTYDNIVDYNIKIFKNPKKEE